MRVAIISFTQTGAGLAVKIAEILKQRNDCVTTDRKYAGVSDSITGSVSEWAGEQFQVCDALIFIGASGIAVRAIAPHIKSKTEDPAVLVIDEAGTYCISLISGHLGGANELTRFLAREIQAQPVITTATDVRRKWSVDVFAKKNRLYISDMEKAKRISAKILREEPVAVYVENGEFAGEPPEEICLCEEADIYIGIHRSRQMAQPLYLIPRTVILGIGCRKGASQEKIEDAVKRIIRNENISKDSIKCISSIELKASEEGLVSFCKKWGLEFQTYSAEELGDVRGDFSSSEFVQKTTGVDNVCERSAVKASQGGRLLVKKQVYEGVTVALAVQEWSVCFE